MDWVNALTIEDCLDLYEIGFTFEINDGKIVAINKTED